MAWFSKKQPTAVVEEIAPKKVTTGPKLAVLQPDIAGISTFSLTLQDDAAEAEQLISGLRADVRRGTHAFWAMHDRPIVDESMHVETLVLIRAKTESDLVYVVSFLDLESALSFTRFELRRGLYIGNVMIYWAAFTQVREELEGVTILPSTAPPSVREVPLGPDPRIAPALPEAQASVAIAEPVAEPEPELESVAEAEARLAVERYLQENPEKAAGPVAEEPPVIEGTVGVIEPPVIETAPAPITENMPIFDDEPVTEEAAVADALVLQHPPVAEPVVEAEPEPVAEVAPPESDLVFNRRQAPFTPKRKWSAREARQRFEAEQEQLEVGAEEPTLLTDAQEYEALQVISGPVSTYAGDEEAEAEPAIEIEAKAAAIDPANGLPRAEKYSEFDIALEVERLLKNRKWESREGPFRGFKSPPGRF